MDELPSARAQAAVLGLDLAVELGAEFDGGEVPWRIPMRAAEAANADRATLISLQDDDLVVEAGHDSDDLPVSLGLRSRMRKEPAFLAASVTRAPVQTRGPQFDGFPSARPGEDEGHVMLLPLVFRGEVTGFLHLLRRGEPPFNQTSADIVHVIATVAAVNLRNARLFADAQRARRGMKNLLDVVVHELRSPLTVAAGYVTMMRDGTIEQPPRSWERPLQMVEDKLAECQTLVEELLLAARLESGRVTAERTVVELETLARRAADRATPKAALLKATVSTEAPQGGIRAIADPAHVDRILNNLIGNALDHGGDRAQVTVTAAHDGKPYISVSDHGPGVGADERDRIFERFVRGRGSSGSGLGLYLSRQLAENLGGSLELGDPGGTSGARFVLRLPDADTGAQ